MIRYELKQIPDPSHPVQDQAPEWELVRVFDTGSRYWDDETQQWRMRGLRTIVPQHRWHKSSHYFKRMQNRKAPWLIRNGLANHHVIPVEAAEVRQDTGTVVKVPIMLFLALTDQEVSAHHPELLS